MSVAFTIPWFWIGVLAVPAVGAVLFVGWAFLCLHLFTKASSGR